MSFTREQVEKAVKAKGYRYFEKGSYNVNIIGIRNSAPGKKVTNVFDDWLTISFKGDDGTWKFYCWAATTDPGKAPMLLGNKGTGTARVVPGQYPGSHKIRLHQGKYRALGQMGLIKLYRDANKDLIYDETTIVNSYDDGINIHKAGQDSTWVEHWSHGCQVFKRVKDFDEFMKICTKAEALHGNSFTYTLIESKDIV
jgi:hypothetical protein